MRGQSKVYQERHINFLPKTLSQLILFLLPSKQYSTIQQKMSFKTTAAISSFGGTLLKLTHFSSTVGTDMALNLYLPPRASSSQKVPVLFYLAGLTCTGDNGAEKGFFQYGASQKGIAVVYPDTSPRKSLFILHV